jgi:hypothetical protein
LIPAHTTATGVRPSAVRSALMSNAAYTTCMCTTCASRTMCERVSVHAANAAGCEHADSGSVRRVHARRHGCATPSTGRHGRAHVAHAYLVHVCTFRQRRQLCVVNACTHIGHTVFVHTDFKSAINDSYGCRRALIFAHDTFKLAAYAKQSRRTQMGHFKCVLTSNCADAAYHV